MSAIYGILRLDGGRPEPGTLERMRDALAERGSDGGAWADGPVALGGLARERPTIRNERGDVVLVADARLDDREVLRRAIEERGLELRDASDTELLLRAYEAWGTGCVEKLVGDFALAVWDARVQRLFLAVDPFAMRPLVYHRSASAFAWATEPHALFAAGVVAPRPSRAGITDVLLGDFRERSRTLYEDVQRVPGGSLVVVERGSARESSWWEPGGAEIRYSRDEDYAAHFGSVFAEAVRSRLRGSRPAGVLVSGGLDSSAIAAQAMKITTEIEGLHWFFDHPRCDERAYVDDLARATGLPVWTASAAEHPEAADFDRVRRPGVLWGATLHAYEPLLRHARERGATAVLTGAGGDELFTGGAGSFWRALLAGRPKSAAGVLWWQSRATSVPEVLARYVLSPLVPPRFGDPAGLVARRMPRALASRGLRRAGLRIPADRSVPLHRPSEGETASQREILEWLEVGWNANVSVPSTNAYLRAFGLEARHPFLDRRLVELMLRLPDSQRRGALGSKHVLRSAMRGILPERIRTRTTKGEFSPVVDRELRDRQRSRVEALLRRSRLADLGLLRHELLESAFVGYVSGTDDGARIWLEAFVSLELWLEDLER